MHIKTLLNIPVMNKCSVFVETQWWLTITYTFSWSPWYLWNSIWCHLYTPDFVSFTPGCETRVVKERGRPWKWPFIPVKISGKGNFLRRERSQVFKDTVQSSSSVPEARRLKAPPTSAALQTASINVKPSAPHECGVCGKNHPTDRCLKLLHCNGSERRERVHRAGLCYRCLLKGHIVKGCSSVCSKCNGRHHKLLCGVQSLSAGSSPNVKGFTKPVTMASMEISRTVESLASMKPSASNATETTSYSCRFEHTCVVTNCPSQSARCSRGDWGHHSFWYWVW